MKLVSVHQDKYILCLKCNISLLYCLLLYHHQLFVNKLQSQEAGFSIGCYQELIDQTKAAIKQTRQKNVYGLIRCRFLYLVHWKICWNLEPINTIQLSPKRQHLAHQMQKKREIARDLISNIHQFGGYKLFILLSTAAIFSKGK